MALCVASVSPEVCTGFTTQDHLPTPPSPFSLLYLLPEASIRCCYLLSSTAEAIPFFSEVGHAFARLLQVEVELSLLSERLPPSPHSFAADISSPGLSSITSLSPAFLPS